MNRIALSIFLGCTWIHGALANSESQKPTSAQTDRRVVALELKENGVTYVPTNPNVTIFLQFPSPIEDFTGRGFTEDPTQVAGDFFLRHLDGDNYLTITPMTDVARRTLHVVCGGKGYPIHMFPAAEDQAWDKVIFNSPEPVDEPISSKIGKPVRNGPAKKPAEAFQVARTAKPPLSRIKEMNTERALGIIDTLRLLANLPERKAKAVVDTNPALTLSIKEKRQSFEAFTLTTHFVLRNNVLDALGFAVTIENTSKDELTFAPDSFTVRAGQHVYSAFAADFNPIIPPKTKIPVFFVLTGDNTGLANNLAVENDFNVSIDLIREGNAHPTTTLDVPTPSSTQPVEADAN
jgi:hypothetical protein